MATPRNLQPPAGPAPGGSVRADAHAVVIGINRYADPQIRDLRYARADAEAVYAVLTDPTLGRFDPDRVTFLLDEEATQRRIRSAIGTHLPRQADEEDTVYIYYAGHGAPVINPRAASRDGLEKYLVPHDAELDDLRASGISMDEVQKFFGWITSRQVLFFIDSCYSGGAGGRSFEQPDYQPRAALTDEFLDAMAGEGRCVVTACGVNEVSLEVPEIGHGLFTHALVEGLRGAADTDGDGRVTIQELYDFICARVTEQARKMGGSMNPVQKGFVQGRVYLTAYETAAQKEARSLAETARRQQAEGALEAALDTWRRAAALVPDDPALAEGLAGATAAWDAFERRRERKRHVLLQARQNGELTLEEYTRGMTLLDKTPAAMTPVEAEIWAFLDPFTDGKMPAAVYLDSIRLLTASEAPVPAVSPSPPPPVAGPQAPPRPSAPPQGRPPAAGGDGAPSIGGDGAPAGGKRLSWKVWAGLGVAVLFIAYLLMPGGSVEDPQLVTTGGLVPGAPEDAAADPFAVSMVMVPAGTFEMGATDGDEDEMPVHAVTLAPFRMSATEVTQGLWKAVMGTEPWKGDADVVEGDDYPAVYVSYDDVLAFIDRLNARDPAVQYRLPTEAEWEYAARAGDTHGVFAGTEDEADLCRYANVADAAAKRAYRDWEDTIACDDGFAGMAPVGSRMPNALGLYDMTGNVWEWVADWYGPYEAGPATDPAGPATGTDRVFRGGSWTSVTPATFREYGTPGFNDYELGFRLLRRE